MHSLGWDSGYVLPTRQLPNPIDIILLYAQKASIISFHAVRAVYVRMY